MLPLIAASAFAFAPIAEPLKERIVLASMFKNGYSIVLRQIDVGSAGEHTLDAIPRASLGTLWFTTSDGMKLLSVKNVAIDKTSTVPASSFEDLLALNKDRQVSLTTINLGLITGKLKAVNGEVVTLDSGGSVVMIPRAEIRKIEISGESASTRTVHSTSRALQFKTSGAGSIYMLSLEQGLSWQPSYAVELKDKKNLEVVAKSTVINQNEDLNGIEVRFITGWPNVPYAGSIDPLIDLGAMPPPMREQLGMRGGAFANQAPAAKSMADAMPIPTLGGIQAEDLFYYRQPNVTLKRGEGGYFLLFSMTAPYEELYTWDIADFVQDANYRPVQDGDVQDVWHILTFTNTSKQPFSTGPATIFKVDGTTDSRNIVGQDEMRYAAPGGKAELQMTKAMDISADQLEEEVSRDRGVLKDTYNRATHDLVTLKGTLTVVNHKGESAKMRIRKSLTGEVVSTDPSAKVVKIARGLRDVNSHALVEWTATVPAGKTATLTYTYKVYIRVA